MWMGNGLRANQTGISSPFCDLVTEQLGPPRGLEGCCLGRSRGEMMEESQFVFTACGLHALATSSLSVSPLLNLLISPVL